LSILQPGYHDLSVASVVDGEVSDFSRPISHFSYGKLDSSSWSPTKGQDSGLLGAMDEISVGSSFLGFGFDMINSTEVSSRTVRRNFPIFDLQGLKMQPVVKDKEFFTSVFDTYEESAVDFMESMNGKLNINASGFWGGASMSSTFGSLSTSKSSHSFKMLDAYVHSYNLTMQSGMSDLRNILDKDFLLDLYDPNMSPAKLMDKYGTHFITGVDMGGRLKSTYLLEADEQSSIDNVNLAISMQFNYGVGNAGGDASIDWRKEANEKHVSAKTAIWALGGNSDEEFFDFSSDDQVRKYYAAWAKTLNNSPALMGIGSSQDLIPIWNLIDSINDSPEYSWTYEDGTNIDNLTRSAQLQEYFWQYGREQQVKFYNTYGHEVSLPTKIENITVGGQAPVYDSSVGDYVYYVRPEADKNENIELRFNVLPSNATLFDKEYSVQPHFGNYLTISKSGIINMTDNAKLGETIRVILSVGGIRQTITLKTARVFDITFDAGDGSFGKDNYGQDIKQIVRKVDYLDTVQSISREIDNSTGKSIEPILKDFVFDKDNALNDVNEIVYTDGWLDEKGKLFEFGYLTLSDITLFPKWKKEYHTITFDANEDMGGYFKNSSENTYTIELQYRYDELVQSLLALGYSNPVKDPIDGNKQYFDNWYISKTSNEPFVFNKSITEDITLFAKYKQTRIISIEFDLMGGEGDFPIKQYELEDGDNTLLSWAIPQDHFPQKGFYDFRGWSLSKDKYEETGGKWIFDNTVIYAWYHDPKSVSINIAYDFGDGTEANGGIKNVVLGEKLIKPSNPSYSNYTFVNWFKTKTTTTPYDFNSVVTEAFTLYARFKRNQYTVVFDTNGGDSGNFEVLANNGRVEKPNDPKGKYRTFLGWYDKKEGGVQINFSNLYVESNMTIYAHWSWENTVTGNNVLVRTAEVKVDKNEQTWGESDPYDTVYIKDLGFNKVEMLNLGYKTMQVSMTIDVKEIDDGYQYVNLYRTNIASSAPYEQIRFEHGRNYIDKNYREYTFNFRARSLNDFEDNSFVIRYGSSGSLNDDWLHKNLRVRVTFSR